MRSETERVNDPFRYALVIKVKKLLAKMKILERGRATGRHREIWLKVGALKICLDLSMGHPQDFRFRLSPASARYAIFS